MSPPHTARTLVTGAPGCKLQVAGQKLLGGGWEQHARAQKNLGTEPSRAWLGAQSRLQRYKLISTARDSPRLEHPGSGCSLGHGAAGEWGPRHDLAPMHRIPSKHRYLPCHLPPTFFHGAGRRDETAPSGICRVPAGMSQAPFPARQCQGEETPRREGG